MGKFTFAAALAARAAIETASAEAAVVVVSKTIHVNRPLQAGALRRHGWPGRAGWLAS
jgi:hypothetical protein